jgi:hypothetical protein
MNKKRLDKTRFYQIGFVAMFIMTLGLTLFQFIRPADGTEITATVASIYQKEDLIDMLYPVGSVYISTDSVNPGDKFGGTWAAYGSGRTLVGVNTSDVEFNAVGKTGGAKTHTLTTAEMPSHTHTQNAHNHTWSLGANVVANAIGTTSSGFVAGYNSGKGGLGPTSIQPSTATNQNTGGGGAHNNLQPYITVYMWQRTD